MDSRMFFVELLKVLSGFAWPVLVGCMLIWFRQEIRELLSSLASLEGFGIRAAFKNQLDQVWVEAKREPRLMIQTDELKLQEKGQRLRLIEQAQKEPKVVIVDAWNRIESAMYGLLKAKGAPQEEGTSAHELASRLKDRGCLDNATFKIALELRELRNKALHLPDFELKGDQASSYVSIALAMADLLEKEAQGETKCSGAI